MNKNQHTAICNMEHNFYMQFNRDRKEKMKRVFKFTMIAALLLFAGNAVHAQVKIGYINSNELIQSMPEAARADSQLTKYINEQRQPFQALQEEFQRKLEEYQAMDTTTSAAIRADKEKELQSLNERAQQFQTRLQQDAQKKEQELFAPIQQKVIKAINEVAEENEYTYVIDNSGNILLKAPEGDNMLPKVKQKLGL